MKKLLTFLLFFLTLSASQAQIVGTLPFTFVNGVTADATQVMANYQFIINQVNANAANNGANSNITSLSGLTTPLSPGQGGSQYYSGGTSTGSANAQVVSSGITPTGFTLTAGKVIAFTSGFTNTGTTTFAINGTTATIVKKLSSSGLLALTGGEIVTGNIVVAFYDGAQYNLLTDKDFQLLGKQVSLASAATTDLGTAQTHNINVTGTTTITSFGSSAQSDYPVYYLTFAGSLTITNNNTSLILPGGVNYTTAANDTARLQYLGSGNWQVANYTRANFVPLVSFPPTVQTKTTGTSLTYTPTAGTSRIRVRMCGGGGGGAAQVTNNGSAGTDTSFQGSAGGFVAWTAIHGGGGVTTGGAPGTGGTGGANGTGTLVVRISGGSGTVGPFQSAIGGTGGVNPFGGFGSTAVLNGAGSAGTANTGAGGGGGATSGANNSGSAGGAGEYVEFWVTVAQLGATATYTVGSGGNGGAAGTSAGGNGAAGIIIIEEF